jgi:hypothetical protein
MGNFDALVGEIARRRRNRWVLSALALNWGIFALVLCAVPGLPA